MNVARELYELDPRPRAVAVGTFDGVHRGHRRVVETAVASGLPATVVTFEPHPRSVLGDRVPLLATVERRLELLAELGVEETLVLRFDRELASLTAEAFADQILRPLGTELVVAGESFRFGRGRAGDLRLLEQLGLAVRPVPSVDGVSSTSIRALVASGEVAAAARLLGRPAEVEGIVVAGDRRGARLGFPTANLELPPDLVVPARGIYAGAAGGIRAAVSVGTNPHYGGREQRVEAFLLDFSGDLYGERLVVALWRRLRDERAFASEAALVAQIAHDVEEARRAVPP